MRRSGYDLKLLGGLEEFHTNMERTQPGKQLELNALMQKVQKVTACYGTRDWGI